MVKVKQFKFSNILNILKCSLLAIIITLVGIIILAVVLKFVDLSSFSINYINDIIKAIAIFVMMMCVKKQGEEKLVLKAILYGASYSLLCFVIFSAFNGVFNFNLGFVYDLLFAVIVSVIVSIILKILKRKTF